MPQGWVSAGLGVAPTDAELFLFSHQYASEKGKML